VAALTTLSRIRLTWVTVVWRRELGMLVNWTDILDKEIVNAAWAVAGMVAKPRAARQTAANLDTAAWADTDRLIRDALAGIAVNPELPTLAEDEAAEVAASLKRHEVQGALQVLLAVRLTDAPVTDAANAREAVRLALRNASPWYDLRRLAAATLPPAAAATDSAAPGDSPTSGADPIGTGLSQYFDDRISALVRNLEVRVGHAGLEQVRAEAYNSPIVALLGVINRQMAARADAERDGQAGHRIEVADGRGVYVGDGGLQVNLFSESNGGRIESLLGAIERLVIALADPTRGGQDEAKWVNLCRRQIRLKHGRLDLPDFGTRRTVPVNKIYVPTTIEEIKERDDHPFRVRLAPNPKTPPLNVWSLVGLLDRTVLLGDPGGGKTTAAKVLANHFASKADRRIPFLVPLREYAAAPRLEWSVAEWIEQDLRTFHQSSAPAGLVERLLLTGRAVVIFDGLDELLDPFRRRDVSERVEQFCSLYPLTPVLVTSRFIGYDQAKLDDEQFTCYRLGRFGEDEVCDYVTKWFGMQDDVSAAQAAESAQGFLAESANATDLRANPLLLSLMCILYKGAGTLPGDRARIYQECAEMMLRKWDGHRHLHWRVLPDDLVNRTIPYLAWWLFTRTDRPAVATERELVAKTTEFLYQRAGAFEAADEARAAAREFVEFCRTRMWVFSEAGTTADGERLYAFTHRTFLEYFEAAYLARTSDTPEDLAGKIANTSEIRLADLNAAHDIRLTNIVAELAIQIKNRDIEGGADRIYKTILEMPLPGIEVGIRWSRLMFLWNCLASVELSLLTKRQLTAASLDFIVTSGADRDYTVPLYGNMFASGERYGSLVSDELSKRLAQLMAEATAETRRTAFYFLFEVAHRKGTFAGRWATEQFDRYARQITEEAMTSSDFRQSALHQGVITLEQALAMPGHIGGVARLLVQENWSWTGQFKYEKAAHPETAPSQLRTIGDYLIEHPAVPWASTTERKWYGVDLDRDDLDAATRLLSDELSGLGFAAVFAIYEEIARPVKARSDLSGVPMPRQFRQLFRNWNAGQVDLVEFLDE
jgi:hypothetical protein